MVQILNMKDKQYLYLICWNHVVQLFSMYINMRCIFLSVYSKDKDYKLCKTFLNYAFGSG